MPSAVRGGPRVWLASCRAVLDSEKQAPDDATLLTALADRGVEADTAAWDDPAIDWGAADLVVIRSTWDYQYARDAFVSWAERVEAVTTLANPAATVRANTDKHYLRDLEAAGVPTVSTHFVEPGQTPAVPSALADQPIVVKPAVSAGARDTAPYEPDDHDAGVAHVARLLDAGRTVLLQPYQHRVDEAGEAALVFVDGRFSHGLHKAARLAVGRERGATRVASESITPREPSPAERDVAGRVLAAADGEGLLYARVDLVDSPDAGPQLLELELTEPSLFLPHAEGAGARLADAIVARLPR